MAQLIKNPPAMQKTWVQFLGLEYPLEKGKATHPSLENSMDCIVHRIAKNQTQLSNFHFNLVFYNRCWSFSSPWLSVKEGKVLFNDFSVNFDLSFPPAFS